MSGRIKVAPKEQRMADGIVFASKHEMQCYVNQFRPLMKSGSVQVELQVPFWLFAGSDEDKRVPVCRYIADFVVTEKDGTMRIYDAKGMRTEIYKLKKKWFEACWPKLRIVEI